MYFIGDIHKLTLDNTKFHKVLYTTSRLQVVLMSLNPGQDIGYEVHPHNDQFIRIERGKGTSVLGNSRDVTEYVIKSGSVVVVPAGTWHNITNTGTSSLKLYTIYSPPEH